MCRCFVLDDFDVFLFHALVLCVLLVLHVAGLICHKIYLVILRYWIGTDYALRERACDLAR